MSKRPQIWVGIKGGRREVFYSNETPTDATHGKRYGAAIGPFRTVKGAEFMARFGGASNPQLQTVADAESAAKTSTYKERVLPINVVMIGDGYVYGASMHPESGSATNQYWVGLRLEREPFTIYSYKLPEKLADDLTHQGTPNQEFGDGYEAARALSHFKGKKVDEWAP